jgi:hypothetical protein
MCMCFNRIAPLASLPRTESEINKSWIRTRTHQTGRIFANLMLGVLLTAGISFGQFTGTVWENTPDAGNAGDPTNMGAGLASAQFVSSSIQFCSVPGGEPGCPTTSAYTVGAFLNNPVFTLPVNGFDPTINLDNTEVQLTGSIFLSAGANTFMAGHDDGFTMLISGGPGTVTCSTQSGALCVNVPGATAFVSTPFTITPTVAGIYNFTLNYSECCGPPAYLLFAYANGSPVGSAQIFKSFGAPTIAFGGTTSLNFTVLNPNASGSLTSVAFTDTLPAGLAVTTPNGLSGTCGGGTITAVAGSGTVSLAGATLAAGVSCTFSLNVTGTAVGLQNNSVTVSSNIGMGNTATASVTVVGPPTIAKAFGASSITVGGSTSLTFTVTNPNAATILTGIAFTDNLPAGLIVAAPNGLTGSCNGGTITAVARSTTVSLSGAALAAGVSCTFSVNVTGTTAGPQFNSVSVTSANGGPGNTSNASITVGTASPPPSSVTCPATSSAEVGVPFSSPAIAVTGGTPPYTFSVVGTLPAGLTLNATTGAVTGTPAATGAFSIQATDSTGVVIGSCPFTINLTVTSNAAFLMRYAANLNIGESYVDITNTGANGAALLGPGFGTQSGNICVNVYTFDPGEELISCCSCLVTPDQTVNLGVNRDLTVKTLTGVVPTSVTVKLLASLAGGDGNGTSCTNSAAGATTANLVGGMTAWGTTLHANPVGSYDSTEAPFIVSTLSQSELASIGGRCSAILGNGSGFGVCNSCRAGALGATALSH